MNDLNALKEEMDKCSKCVSLCESRSQVVFGHGKVERPILFVIEGTPGGIEDDDKSSAQFDRILKWIGVSREDCFFSSAVLCGPPNDRDPLWDEIQACRWRLMMQISLIRPHIIVCLGRHAAASVLGVPVKGPLKNLFSNEFLEFELENEKYKWMVTYHPSHLLRKPSAKSKVVSHWKLVKEYNDNI